MTVELGIASGKVCGVVVTYHPDSSVVANVTAMVRECGDVIVVDNGSAPVAIAGIAALSGVEVILLGENRGLAAALNRGAKRALERGCGWIVTFDQDSCPESGMVAALLRLGSRFANSALVGPVIVEEGFQASQYRWVRPASRVRWLFRRASTGADLESVTCVITSGSLISLSCWESLGGFDEAFFIDYVDVEFCLRARRAGLRIAVAEAARLKHHLGRRSTLRMLGHDFRPMNHAPFRHYYMARNRVTVWRRHACAQPHWALFDFSFAVYNGFRAVVLEQHRWLKLKAMVLGTWDGLRGRSGPMPGHRARALRP